MSHPFGDLLTRHLHRKHGLSQAKLAAGILQAPSVVSQMCRGERLTGPQARERVVAIVGWLHQQGALDTADEANAMLAAAGLSALRDGEASQVGFVAAKPNSSPRETARGASRLTNLPAALTRFIGREREIEALRKLAAMQRLITLTGTGGVGKTRLALEVAGVLQDDFDDGTWLVELASLADPALVSKIVGAALGLVEQPTRTPLQALVAFLEDKRLLLMLDNCEHVIGACAELAETLLRSCPRLHILATSREALGVAGEVTWRVPSLSVPDLADADRFEALGETESAQMFAQHARMALPTFVLTRHNAPAVGRICRRLDGIPLAIEMAAAQVAALTPQEISDALSSQFLSLMRGNRTNLQRHQTLRATMDWSYALLNADEQTLFANLSLFAGGWGADAANAVSGEADVLPTLIGLVNKSLAVADRPDARPDGSEHTRFRMLEPVRQYAFEKFRALPTDAQRAARNRHLGFYLELAETSEPNLSGPNMVLWLDQLEREHDNLRAALNWAFEDEQVTMAMRMVVALNPFWVVRNHWREGREWVAKALEKSGPEHRTKLRATLLLDAGNSAISLLRHDEARRVLDEAMSIGLALDEPVVIAESYALLGWNLHFQGDLAAAYPLIDEGIRRWRALGDPFGLGRALFRLAGHTERDGDRARAFDLLTEANALFEQVGEKTARVRALARLGRLVAHRGDLERAIALCMQSLNLCLETNDKVNVNATLLTFATIALALGRDVRAARIIGSAEGNSNMTGRPIMQGDLREYDRMLGVLRSRLGEVGLARALAEGRALSFDAAIAQARAFDLPT